MDMLEKISLAGLVPVIKVEDAEDAAPLCAALKEGGLPVAEITFRTDAAEKAIQNVHAALPDVLLGAGTVLTVDQVKRAVDAGAGYIVSPGLNPAVVGYCVQNNIPVLPGCANPSDIETALSFGVTTVKFFPAEAAGGINFIKAISAPYGNVSFIPTGGINEKNVMDYLSFPKVRAVGGSWMVPSDAVKAKDWAKITALTANAVKLTLGYEIAHIGVNASTDDAALAGAKTLCALFGWTVKEGGKSVFAGTGVELMKIPFRGTHGHIGVAVNSIPRARWHLEQKGVAFDEDSASYKNGKVGAIYLRDEIAGFAIHLLERS